MKIKSNSVSKDILYIGTVEGEEYKALGTPPCVIGGIDSTLEQEIEVTKIIEFIQIGDIIYASTIALDKDNNIVYTDIYEL